MASLLPSGPLSTSGSQIVDAAGNPVRIASVGWQMDFGLDDMWKTKEAGFNTIRVSWTNHLIDEDIQRIKTIVANAKTVGIKVIMVNHANSSLTPQQQNGLWYDLGGASDNTDGQGNAGTTTDAKFLSDWVRMAREFVGNDTVIGYDIRNEPLGYYWDGMSSWEAGANNPDQNIRWMYERVGKAIQAIDPDKLMIFEGPQRYDGNYAGTGKAPWGDLSLAGQLPVVLTVPNKVVYSVHDYPPYIGGFRPVDGAERIDWMNKSWGYLVRDDIAPVWIGEMGANFTGVWGGENPDESRRWAQNLIDYMNGKMGAQGGPTFSGNEQPVPGNWWVWGNFSGGDLQGTLNDNGTFRAEQKAFWDQLLYTPGAGGGVVDPPPPPPVTPSDDNVIHAGDGQTITDDAGHVWTINASGQVTMDGQLAGYSRGVLTLAKVNGTIWQENDQHLWWSWTGAGWSDGAGTSQSPIGSGGGPVDPPPPPTDIPAAALDAGYTLETFGPEVDVDANWHRVNFWGMDPNSMNVQENANGSVTLAGPWSFNAQISTARMDGSPLGWSGIAFGGGAYIEATLSWENPYNGYGQPQSSGWPAFWANDIEGMSGLYNTNWPGQSYPRNIETDFMEYWSDSSWGGALHDWWGPNDVVKGTETTLPNGASPHDPHKYGFLWVPATETTKGRAEWYFDDVHLESLDLSWNLYDPTKPPPPEIGSTAWAHLDTRHLALLLGTGAGNPMTVYDVEVWQKSTAENISTIPPDPPPTGNGDRGQWTTATLNGMEYNVLLPENYDPNVAYPVVLFLHQLANAVNMPGQPDVWFNDPAFRAAHPAIVVVPELDQSADYSGQTVNWGGVSPNVTDGENKAIAVLKKVLADHKHDPGRIYVTGDSMGGIGTWEMMIDYNAQTGQLGKIFAAGLPLAGADYEHGYPDPDPAIIEALRNVPIWAIHGAQDGQVPLEWDRAMAAALAGSPTFKYTEDPALGHDVWDDWYAKPEVWSWLFAQRSNAAPPPAEPPVDPNAIGSGSDTIVIALSSDPDGPAGNMGRWAQFTLNVDGKQIGGVHTVDADRSLGQTREFTFKGNFGPGAHKVTVTFANNSMTQGDKAAFNTGGDRNLYVERLTYNGAVASNQVTGIYESPWYPPESPDGLHPGNAVFNVNDATAVPAGAPSTPTTTPADVFFGSGPDRLTLYMAEDPFEGDAQFTVKVDGKQVGGTFTTTAVQWQGQQQAFNLNGDWAPGAHEVTVSFVNDHATLNDQGLGWDHLDRNLYVTGLSLNGGTSTGAPWELPQNGARTFQVTDGGVTPPPPVDPPPPAGGASPNNTVIVAGDGKTITDAAGDVWTISASKTVTRDGALAGYSRGVEKLAYVDGVVWQQNDQNLWWSWNGTTWGTHAGYAQSPVPVTPPPPAVVPEIEVLSGGVTATVDPTKAGNIVVGGNMIDVMTPGVVGVIGGSQPTAITFLGLSSTIFVGQDGSTTATADKGSNLWVVGRGAMTITAGADDDAFFINKGDGLLTINAFDAAEDKLVVASDMKASMTLADNGAGGTLLTFGDLAGGIEAKNVTVTADAVRWQ